MSLRADGDVPASAFDRRGVLSAGMLLAAGASVGTNQPVSAAVRPADPMVPVPVPLQVPAKEGLARLGDTDLWYWDTGGTGTPIVLMHPASGSAQSWPYQQPVFAKAGYRVIAYSRRGYYKSAPVPDANPGSASEDLHRLAAFLSLGKFHIVASAGGCAFANDYALSHPERVRSLVLSSGLGGVQDPEYLALLASLSPKGFSEMPVEFRELGPSYRAANPDGVKQWVEITSKAVNGNRRGQVSVNQINWAKMQSLAVPTLLVAGDADLNAPPSIMRMFAARIPGSEIALIAEAGHSAYWEQPEIFNRTVLDFIGRH